MKLIRHDQAMTHTLRIAGNDPVVRKLMEQVIAPARKRATDDLGSVDLGVNSHVAARLQGAIQFIDELTAELSKH